MDGRCVVAAAGAKRPPILRLEEVTKRFGDLTACDRVSLDLHAGEVLALLGENGAGKSTLMKTLYGVHPADGGRSLLDGAPAAFTSPRQAMTARIGMVFQTFALIPALSVRDNLALAWPGTPWHLGRRGRHASGALRPAGRSRARGSIPEPGWAIFGGRAATRGTCKVLNLDARVIILDEPTAVLTPAEAHRLHVLIRQLAATGVAVVLITHKLADVEAAADRVAVLRRGRLVVEGKAGDMDRAALVEAMMGRTETRRLRRCPRPTTPCRAYCCATFRPRGHRGRCRVSTSPWGAARLSGWRAWRETVRRH